MDDKEFEGLLTTFGANPERWPADMASGARALLEASNDARALYAEAEALDTVLDTLDADAMPQGMGDRIVAATIREDISAPASPEFRAPLLRLAMSAAASLVIGASLGLSDLGELTTAEDSDAVSLAFGLNGGLSGYYDDENGDDAAGEEL